MTKFFKYIFWIFISSLLILYSLQFLADNGLRKSEHSVYHDWLKILEGDVNSDIIISGSSRAYFGYNPSVLEDKLKMKTFNLGYSAAGYQLQLEKLKIYLARNKKPKIIVQNIDLTFFNEDKLLPNENEFIPFLNDTLIFNLMINYNLDYKIIQKIPLLKYNNRLSLFSDGIYSNIDNKRISRKNYTFDGFQPVDLNFVRDQENLIRLKKIKAKDLDFPKKIELFLKFYKEQLSSNTKIIFVWAPEHVERLTKENQLEKNKVLFYLENKIKGDKSILLLDMSNEEFSRDTNNFFDTFHFNRIGANKFSEKLSEQILKIID